MKIDAIWMKIKITGVGDENGIYVVRTKNRG